MTLSTDIYVHGTGVSHREIFDKVNELLEIEDPVFTEGPASEYRPGDYTIDNAPMQGFNAWVMSDANADGSEVIPAHDEEWCEDDCDSARCVVPPFHVHVDLDTAYGYRGPQGQGCADLHASVIAALIPWLAERGCTLHWVDEFNGTLHEGTDHLAEFAGHGGDAQNWFDNVVMPAIVSNTVSPRA